MVIDVRLLGGFRVSVNNQLVESLSSQRSQSLLACLVLQAGNAPLSRAYLAGLSWPESSDQQARTNLRRELHKLRQSHTAIDQAIRADQNTLAWAPSVQCTVDVHRLQAQSSRVTAADSVAKRLLVAADLVQLYGGHLLPGVTDQWVLEQRDEILRNYLAACQQLGRLLTCDGELGKATSLFEATVAQDPLDESAWLALMELHVARNDRARSIRTYHQCVNALRRELDLAPSEPLRLLYRKLTEDNSPPKTHAMQRSPDQAAAAVSARLFGRQRQQLELETCWDEVKKKGAKLVVIQGDAGIGKTRLADAFLQLLQGAGTAIARSRAYAAEGSLPFAPVKDWLKAEPLLKATHTLTVSARHSLHRVFPDIAADKASFGREDRKQSQKIEPDQSLQRLAVFEAMADAITTSGEPLVLFLDDIQWCDNDTLQWLRFLHRHAPSYPVMILTTARSEALVEQHPVTSLISELRGQGQTANVEVNPLQEAESRDLIAYEQRVADSAKSLSIEETKRILARAEGSPLFLVELVRAKLGVRHCDDSDSTGSGLLLTEKLTAVIQYRLSGLSSNAQQVASLAATIGRQFSDQLLIAASGLDESVVVDAVDELWQRKLVRVDQSGDYVFSHDYIREAVYAQLNPTRRRKLHLQVVDGLKQLYEDEIELVTGELAAHCECAGLTSEAVQWYQKCALYLQAQFAFSEAMDKLENGLALLRSMRGIHKNPHGQIEMLISLANCAQILTGFTSPEMLEICQRMQALLPQIRSLGLRIDVLERVRRYYGNVDVPKAIELSEELVALSGELGDDIRSLSAYRSLGFSLFQLGDQVTADATMAQANQVIVRTTQEGMGTAERPHWEIPLVMGLWASVVAMRADMHRSQEIGAQSCAYPIEQLSIIAQAYIRHFRMQHAMLHHNPSPALEHAAWAADVASTYDYGMARMVSLYYSGWAHGVLGDHERAIDEITRALAVSRSLHNAMYQPQRWAILAGNQLALNQLDDAEHSLDEAFAVAQSSNQPFWQSELHRLTARLLQARRDSPERIQAALNKAIETSEQQGANLLWLRARLDQARLSIELEQTSKAQRVLNGMIIQQTPHGSCFELEEALALLASLSPAEAPIN